MIYAMVERSLHPMADLSLVPRTAMVRAAFAPARLPPRGGRQ